jgi:hypothetical protein
MVRRVYDVHASRFRWGHAGRRLGSRDIFRRVDQEKNKSGISLVFATGKKTCIAQNNLISDLRFHVSKNLGQLLIGLVQVRQAVLPCFPRSGHFLPAIPVSPIVE